MNALKFCTSESNSLDPSAHFSRWILRNCAREMCWTYARISSLSGKSHQSGASSPKSKKTCARFPAQSRNSALSAEETLRLDQRGGDDSPLSHALEKCASSLFRLSPS